MHFMTDNHKVPYTRSPVRDWLRRHPPLMPFLIFFYHLIWKRRILDGRAGLYFALREMVAEALVSLRVLEIKLGWPEMPMDPTGILGATDDTNAN
jgi:hypothetical protein